MQNLYKTLIYLIVSLTLYRCE